MVTQKRGSFFLVSLPALDQGIIGEDYIYAKITRMQARSDIRAYPNRTDTRIFKGRYR